MFSKKYIVETVLYRVLYYDITKQILRAEMIQLNTRFTVAMETDIICTGKCGVCCDAR